MLKGVDVSCWNDTKTNFKKLKDNGIDFVIIRCGYGKDGKQKDSNFETFYKAAKEAGLKVGVYHYSYCTQVENAVKEASYCLSLIKGKEFDLPVFYDLESKVTKPLGKKAITQIALNFCNVIRDNGYKVGVYANLDWFTNFIDPYSLIDNGYKIWLAQWGVSKPTAKFPYQFWQYTNKLKLAGIGQKFDGDYCEEKEAEIPVLPKDETIERLAIDVINGKYGNGDQRKNNLGLKYNLVQDYVNRILLKDDIEEIAQNVIKGVYGNGQARKEILGQLYDKVQKRVNAILKGKK